MQKKNKIFALASWTGIFIMLIIVCGMISAFVYRVFVSPPIEFAIDKNIKKATQQEVIQVNILNATDTSGIAMKVKQYLRSRGFDVVEIGNYKEKSDESFFIDRLGDINSAQKIAYALGIDESKYKTEIDSNLFLRVTVVLGNDFRKLKPFK